MHFSSSFKTTLFYLGISLFLFPSMLWSQFEEDVPYLKILGTVQDGGSPHIGCLKVCCNSLNAEQKKERKVTSIAVILPKSNSSILFEATPDIISQWKELDGTSPVIFLTHAHIGHYTGLMHLGREALGAKNIPVYVMPKMKSFLSENGPWSQLVSLKNIKLIALEENKTISPSSQIYVTPIRVPHRDEFSETVGFRIQGPKKSVLFIPDINKWSKWKRNLRQELEKVDYAFIDATFFDAEEINHRQIAEIPHPLVKETAAYLSSTPKALKNKVYFIHMNHTNPLLNPKSEASKWVIQQGYHIAIKGQQFQL
jgi:pyrroloquinoline quinone biosynthesis protein B